MARALVVGGGVGGLAAALALARSGHRVTLLERDPTVPTSSPREAFAIERSGAPQSHQTHGFLARIVVLLRERFPDVLADLRAQGCSTLPGWTFLGDPEPGDEDLKVLIVRRTTFEWVLRRAVEVEPGVEMRPGVAVTGLTAARGEDGILRVDGVVTDGGERLTAGLVVDATGRRGDVPGWLRQHGVELPEQVDESGLMYVTHWYRRPDGHEVAMDPKLAGDLGFVKYLAVPGDDQTLSITLAIRTQDREMRDALRTSDGFEAACRALPGPDQFFAADAPELIRIGGVRTMAGLVNRIRRFTDRSGAPLLLGLHAVGDAHTCTNPIYGRGCSLAVLSAALLSDSAACHPDDPAALAAAYEGAMRQEVEPWWQVSVQMDRFGADPALRAPGAGPNPGLKALGAILLASTEDPVLGRGLARFWNLLATPADLMADAAFIARIADVVSRPDDFPAPARTGPSRPELLAALAS